MWPHVPGIPLCRDYDDSKVLSADQRDQLYKAIGEDEDIVFSTCSLSAQHISRSMLATSRTSLNELAAQATIALIQSLVDTGVSISAVCPCNQSYGSRAW